MVKQIIQDDKAVFLQTCNVGLTLEIHNVISHVNKIKE